MIWVWLTSVFAILALASTSLAVILWLQLREQERRYQNLVQRFNFGPGPFISGRD